MDILGDYRELSDRSHTSKRGVAWCGSNRLGHTIPIGVRYRTIVAIVDGELDVWTICRDCEGDLAGYEMPIKHKLGPRPGSDA